MKSSCIILLWLFTSILFSHQSNAQKDVADSLIRVIKTEQQDTNKIWSLIRLADLYNLVKPDTALRLSVEAFELARAINDKTAIRFSLLQVGLAYHVVGNYPKTLQYYFRVLALLEDTPDANDIANIYNLIGHVYMQQENYDEALRYMHKGLAITPELHLLGHTCEIFVQIKNPDSARYYGQRAVEATDALTHPRFRGFALFELAYAHLVSNDYTIALEYFRKAIPLTRSAGNDFFGLNKAYRGIAQTFEQMGNKDSSIYYGRLAVSVALDHQMLHEAQKAIVLMASFYRSRQNSDSALFYMDLSKSINDSIFSQQNRSQLLTLTLDEKLRQIEREELHRKEAQSRYQSLQFAGIALVLVTLVIAFLVFSHSIIAKPRVIKTLGVISLLIVFEFLNLLLHPYLSEITGHSPILLLLIMVSIAAILVPLHHRLERWVSNKLVEKNKRIRLAAAKRTIEELKELN